VRSSAAFVEGIEDCEHRAADLIVGDREASWPPP
jgi:hypothetical protein